MLEIYFGKLKTVINRLIVVPASQKWFCLYIQEFPLKKVCNDARRFNSRRFTLRILRNDLKQQLSRKGNWWTSLWHVCDRQVCGKNREDSLNVIEKRFNIVGFHCVKSVRIRSFSGPYFSAFGLNTEIYGIDVSMSRKQDFVKKDKQTDTFRSYMTKETLKINNDFKCDSKCFVYWQSYEFVANCTSVQPLMGSCFNGIAIKTFKEKLNILKNFFMKIS